MAENPALLTSVARLYYLDGLGQTEIAAIYGVSRSTVSRMLTTARERGIVRITVDDYDPRHHELEDQLIERFGLKRAIVVRGVTGAHLANRRAVGYFAANDVARWIADEHQVGVTGGRTLGEIVRTIPRQTATVGQQFVQLMGMVAHAPGQNEGSELCRSLARRFNGSFHTLNAPALVADKHTRDVFLAHDQIRSTVAMFDDLTLAFVGVGSIDDSMFAEHSVMPAEDESELRQHGMVAEVCGRFIDGQGHEITLPTQDRVISVDLQTLRSIDDVVAVTSGDNRGVALRAVFEGGIATSVVTDDACARAVISGR